MRVIVITPEELEELIVAAVEKALAKRNIDKPSEDPKPEKLIFTRQETAKILDISLPTLHTYTKDGWIQAFRIGYKVRYKWEDIQKSLVAINYGTFKK